MLNDIFSIFAKESGASYKPKYLSRKLVVAIFTLIVAVQIFSIIISAVFLHNSHRAEKFSELERYANDLARNLADLSYLVNSPHNSPYRVSVIALNGEVLFDNKVAISTLDNHLERQEVQNLLQGKSPKSLRLSESQHRENLYFTRFIEIYKPQGEKFILRVSTDKDSLFSYLKHFIPLFATLLLFSVILSALLGTLLTHQIIKPIKNIDLSHPIKTNPYAELHIFMQRISKQKKKIKKQLKSIKQSNAQLKLISNNINDGFLILDSVGNITQSNAKALEMLNLAQDENAFSDALFANAIKDSIDSHNQTFEIALNSHFCQVICMPIIVKNTLKAIIILLFDKSAKRDILELRREFSANVTHELKTPLSSILLSAEMLNNNLVAEADKGEFIAKIYSESKRLLTLIEKILKISFLEEVGLEKECVNLANIIRQIIPSIESTAKEKGIKCTFVEYEKDTESVREGKSENAEILGIPALLEDMVYNLCENAIKYGRENGAIKITLWREKGKKAVILSVADNGIGIALSEQEHIFERFYCVDKSRSKKLGGNGLGLAIVKRIAKIHNAKITLHSELGKGSEFIVRFE